MHHFLKIFRFRYRENYFTAAHPGVQMIPMIQHSSQNIYAFVFHNKYCIQYDPKILFEFCM